MPRLAGVDIPDNKRIVIALQYIFGIGEHSAQQILKATGINESVRAKNLTQEELTRLGVEIERNHVVEGALRRVVAQHISRLKEIKCYRGIRHQKNLPVRGQRTRTNARTRKGPRKTVATKKSIKALH
jgi:small subunit ribosomal protein S13